MTTFDTQELETELYTIQLEDTIKKPMETTNINNEKEDDESRPANRSLNQASMSRPCTLKDFENQSNIKSCTTEPSFVFDGLSPDEEFWIVDIPATIEPADMKGLTIQLGDHSKFKINGDNYCAINKNNKVNFTSVFSVENNDSSYKTINIKPVESVKIRRKLSNKSQKTFQVQKSECVPYPKNLKQRHPVFGVQS